MRINVSAVEYGTLAVSTNLTTEELAKWKIELSHPPLINRQIIGKVEDRNLAVSTFVCCCLARSEAPSGRLACEQPLRAPGIPRGTLRRYTNARFCACFLIDVSALSQS